MSRSERDRAARSDPALDALVERTQGPQPSRRLFHAACGLGYAWLMVRSGLGRNELLWVLGGAAAAAFLGDLVRLTVPSLNRLFFRAFRLLASPRERAGIASSTWYAVGVLLVFLLLTPAEAACCVLVLALADPTASYLGRRWGRRRLGTGTVLGSTSFLVVAYLVIAAFVGPWRALPVAVLVTVAELTPWPLDDNLVVPLTTALGLWLTTGLA